ncbi:MAG: hypothetical protein MI864_17210 [Pseudomonadales bacterium]|nr:hypothetical protein [Pseudomonadales bacterium]
MKTTSKLASILGSEQGQVSCFDIEVFHLNQRHSKNPKYDDIKDSVRNKGIQDPLHIVFHPEQKKWVLSQGGQTRLLICRELYRETGNEDFLYPKIVKQKFTSNLDLCINHLVENHLRGDNTFLETANAVLNIKGLVQLNDGSEPTQEELAQEMSRRGMPIRRQSITAMLYLAKDIAPKITNDTFLSNVSRKLIDSIRTLRNDLENDILGHDFDSNLIEFINSQTCNVSLMQIREHLQLRKQKDKPKPISNQVLASSVSDEFGLKDVVQGTERLPSGFLVNLTRDIADDFQAEVCFFLASLSGVFDGPVSRDVVAGMGFDDMSSHSRELADVVLDRLNLTESDLSGLPKRIFCRANEEGFELLIRLIVGVRTSVNNNPLENR